MREEEEMEDSETESCRLEFILADMMRQRGILRDIRVLSATSDAGELPVERAVQDMARS